MSDEQHPDLQDSTPGPDGADGLGVSSERRGPTGPGQVDTDGIRDTGPAPLDADTPPEQAPGEVEENPEGIEPTAGYPSPDPRSDDKPFEPA